MRGMDRVRNFTAREMSESIKVNGGWKDVAIPARLDNYRIGHNTFLAGFAVGK